MSVIVIVLIVLAALVLLFFVGGLIGARRRAVGLEGDRLAHIARADQALEAARAADRGWDRVLLEEAARQALQRERPEFRYDQLHLVLVEDRPGQDEDRAHVSAVGDEGEVRVVLGRSGGQWAAEELR